MDVEVNSAINEEPFIFLQRLKITEMPQTIKDIQNLNGAR